MSLPSISSNVQEYISSHHENDDDNNNMVMNAISELVQFLASPNLSTRYTALEQIIGLSASPDGRTYLAKTNVIRYLVRMIGDSDSNLSKNATIALINLAEMIEFCRVMSAHNIISRLLDNLLSSSDNDHPLIPLYSVLLSNVTRVDSCARKLLNLDDESSLKGYYIAKLLPLFFKPIEKCGKGQDPFAWVGGIIVNATSIEEGRNILLSKNGYLLKNVIGLISSSNMIRRRAALGIIRNCMFDSSHHEKILTHPDMDLLTELCLRIRGSELLDDEDCQGMPEKLIQIPKNHVMEDDEDCKKMIIDVLRLLTANRFGRDLLKKRKVYPVIRELDKIETNEQIKEKIYDLVHILVLDDPEDEASQEQTVRELEDLGQLSIPKPAFSCSMVIKDNDEFGEEIEEI